MKIALATFLFEGPAGAVAVARRLGIDLARRGHEVIALTTAPGGPPRVDTLDGIRVHRLSPVNLYWVGDKEEHPTWRRALWQLVDLWNPHAYRLVRKVLRAERPDLLHVHKLRGLSPAVWSAAAAARVPIVVQTCHDYETISPEGTLSGGLGSLAVAGSPLLSPYQSLRRRASRHVTAVTAPSRRTLELVRGPGFFPRATARVIPNSHGFEREELDRISGAARAPERPDELRLLYLGRIDGPKGVELLCEAFVDAAREAPGLRLDIVGSGEAEARLRERFANCPRLVFRGQLGGAAKWEAVASCDALVVPSVWEEVFGLVLLEAFAHGKPVVASRIGGIPELVSPGKNGLLFEPGNRAALTKLLAREAAGPSRLRAMTAACFASARAYTRERVVESYLDLYQSERRRLAGSSAEIRPVEVG